jgi:hypothetical protein
MACSPWLWCSSREEQAGAQGVLKKAKKEPTFSSGSSKGVQRTAKLLEKSMLPSQPKRGFQQLVRIRKAFSCPDMEGAGQEG